MKQKERFVYFSSPEHWFQTALELNSTIKELHSILDKEYFIENYQIETANNRKRPATSRAAFLLMTYSLENLLKGISVLRNPEYVNNGKLDKSLKTHNLNDLNDQLKIEIFDEHKRFQNYISKLCVANARYPIGLNENQNLEHPSITELDYQIYFSLFNKYQHILINEFNDKGWNSGLDNIELNTEPGEFKFIENPFYIKK